MTTDIVYRHRTGVLVDTVPAAFQQTITLRPDAVALRTVGGTQQITWREYGDRVRVIAAGLSALGLGRGDTLGVMLTNRPEFNLVDTAALHVGATPFSVYNTCSPEQVAHAFTNAQNKIVVTEQQFLGTVRAAGVALDHVVLVDGPAEGTTALADLETAPDPDFDFDAAWRAVEPGDLVTVIYTSGTTGPSKGVELTHRNVLAQIIALNSGPMDVGLDDRALSYLPAAHVADRISGHAINLVTGIQITTVPDPREIAAALPDARPTVFFGVPRVWQKINRRRPSRSRRHRPRPAAGSATPRRRETAPRQGARRPRPGGSARRVLGRRTHSTGNPRILPGPRILRLRGLGYVGDQRCRHLHRTGQTPSRLGGSPGRRRRAASRRRR
jgi:long-subunit acyl-CoA synthetase (AMP-forming)